MEDVFLLILLSQIQITRQLRFMWLMETLIFVHQVPINTSVVSSSAQRMLCSIMSASSPSSAPAANATIEDCPTVDLGWPHVWKVYGSKCYFLVGYPLQKYTPAKEHCEDVISLKYHTH